MIKSASLDDEFFIALTLNQQQLQTALNLQKIVAEYYNLYQDNLYPELHITLDRIKKEKVKPAKKILQKIAHTTNKITIEINNLKCLQQHDKFLTLEVEETPSLINLATKIHNKLATANISTITNYSDWQFHITLISNHFTDNPIPEPDLTALCLNLDGAKQQLSTTADKIEIWRPTLEPTAKTVASFNI
ncbi:2'-5' RNA ligase family protein [Halanaerobaculum tunisiense]